MKSEIRKVRELQEQLCISRKLKDSYDTAKAYEALDQMRELKRQVLRMKRQIDLNVRWLLAIVR